MAIHVSDSVIIARPIDEVFAYMANYENLPFWTVGVTASRRLSEGEVTTGSRYCIVGTLLGRSVESNYIVTRFERGKRLEGTMTSPMFGFSESYSFEPDPVGTRVTLRVEVQPAGIFRLIGPVMAVGVRRQITADHHRLKHLLEEARADVGRLPVTERRATG